MKKLFLLLIIAIMSYSCQKENLIPIYKQFDDTLPYIRIYSVDTMEMLVNLGTTMIYYRYVTLEDTVALIINSSLGIIHVDYSHPTNTENNQMRLSFSNENMVNPFSSKILMLINLQTISATRNTDTLLFRRAAYPPLYWEYELPPHLQQ